MAELPSTDRNLLIALLAFQNNFIDRPALLAAFDAWTSNKSRPIAELLVEQKKLTTPQRQLIEALATEHLKQHANDPQQSLAALGSVESGRAALATIADDDLQQSLIHLRRSASADTSPLGAADSQADPDRTTSFSIGANTSTGQRFRILRPHAEGGLGRVSVARDEELNREVALKEIKPKYADEPSARARFTLEAEITGGLEHPGIVPVYGLGTYADGRPYYAMRFIRGDSLKDAIDAFFQKYKPKNHREGDDIKLPAAAYHSLEFRQLLGRFIDVCNAVAYAHARGVLHRDLKPGNIMLGKYGETLVVDWGLAKATGKPDASVETSQAPLAAANSRDAASGSEETAIGSAIGTLGYMSPEQAAGRIDQFGPATDIYLLGATLYHILTGHPPHRKTAASGMIQQIQDRRIANPRDRHPGIPSSLAAICLKAMSPDTVDRYPTSLEVSADVERWLADEPVSTWADSLIVRLLRWTRKHPGAVAAVASTVLVSLVALGISSGLLGEKNSQLSEANARLNEANRRLTEINSELQLAEQRAATKAAEAEEERKLAMEVKEFMQGMLLRDDPAKQADNLLGFGDGRIVYPKSPTMLELLDRAADEISSQKIEQRFPEKPLVQADVLTTIGTQFIEQRQFEKGVEHLRRALHLYDHHIGVNSTQALAVAERLGRAMMANRQPQAGVPYFHRVASRRESDLGPDHAETLRAKHYWAFTLSRVGNTDQAVFVYETILSAYTRKYGSTDSRTLGCQFELAEALGSRDPERSVKLREDHLEKLKSEVGFGDLRTHESILFLGRQYVELKRPNLACALLSEYWDFLKRQPSSPTIVKRRIQTGSLLGAVLLDAEQADQAIALIEPVMLLTKDSNQLDEQTLGQLKHDLGFAYVHTGKPQSGLRLLSESQELQAGYKEQSAGFASLMHIWGVKLLSLREFVGAETYFRKSAEIRQRQSPEAWFTFSSQGRVGAALVGQQRYPEAEAILLPAWERLYERKLTIPEKDRNGELTQALQALVDLYVAWDKPDEAAGWKAKLETYVNQREVAR